MHITQHKNKWKTQAELLILNWGNCLNKGHNKLAATKHSHVISRLFTAQVYNVGQQLARYDTLNV